MVIRQFALMRKAFFNNNFRRGTHGSGEDYECGFLWVLVNYRT